MSVKSLKTPIYDRTKDGNVFDWILVAATDYRKIRQRERFIALEKLTDTHRPNDNSRNQRI